MPFAEFQGSNPGVSAGESLLRNVDFGVSLMERAARNQVLLQDAEQRKARFIQDTMMNDQTIQQNRLKLAQMEGEQKIASAKVASEVAAADLRSRTIQTNLGKLQMAAEELPSWVKRIEDAPDDMAINDISAQFHDRFGHLAADPAFAQQYAAVEGEIASRAHARAAAYQTRVVSAANSLGKVLHSNDPAAFSRVNSSPALDLALKEPGFAKAYNAVATAEREHNFKLSEQRQKSLDVVAEANAKADADIRVNKAKAEADKKEAPQYLVESAMKVAQSDKDLGDLEQMAKDGPTGPFIGWLRDMNPYDTSAKVFRAKLQETVPTLARGVFGEVGVLTDADIRNYMATLPNIRAPEERAAKLIELLRSTLEQRRKNLNEIVRGQGYKTGGLPGIDPSVGNGVVGSTAKPPPVTSGLDLQAALAERQRRRQSTGGLPGRL